MLDEAWALSPSVALRPEPFGALAYDFHTRRLSFLKTPVLVDVVRRLEDEPTVADALRWAGVEASDSRRTSRPCAPWPAAASSPSVLAHDRGPAPTRDPELTPTR